MDDADRAAEIEARREERDRKRREREDDPEMQKPNAALPSWFGNGHSTFRPHGW